MVLLKGARSCNFSRIFIGLSYTNFLKYFHGKALAIDPLKKLFRRSGRADSAGAVNKMLATANSDLGHSIMPIFKISSPFYWYCLMTREVCRAWHQSIGIASD